MRTEDWRSQTPTTMLFDMPKMHFQSLAATSLSKTLRVIVEDDR